MLIRSAAVCVAAILLAAATISSAGATTTSLRLRSSTAEIWAPTPPNSSYDLCNAYSDQICGTVAVTASFSGLNAFPRPSGDRLSDGNLTGTVRVTRKYGCQQPDGTRLRGYNRTVVEQDNLNTRWGFGFFLPPSGDVLTFTTYAFLPDAQPGCPSGSQAMTYEIKASGVALELTFVDGAIPGDRYGASGHAVWRGAVAAPMR